MKKTILFLLTMAATLCQLNLKAQTSLYGMTTVGGSGGFGTIFKTDANGNSQQVLSDFATNTIGANPNGSLMQASNGKLYGMTQAGGSNNFGVLFEYDPITATYTKKLDFNGTANGASPRGSLLQASNGKLYGMTWQGGGYNVGVLFEYDPAAATYTKKLDFNGAANGEGSQGSLIQASNGKLYGMTSYGGVNTFGVLFEYDPITATYTKKLDFNGANGAHPFGSLLQASNGILYGVTYQGGVNNFGVLFEYDPITATYTKKLDFNGAANGSYSYGSLMQASNGKFYGMTYKGGVNNQGVLFEYDPVTATCTNKLDFNGAANGQWPLYTNLIEVSNTLGINEIENKSNILIFPNPSSNAIFISSETNEIVGMTIEIYTVMGQKILNAVVQSNSQALNISTLNEGVYFVRVLKQNQMIYQTKISKQ